MKMVVATALTLLILLFLAPVIFLRPASEGPVEESRPPAATLPASQVAESPREGTDASTLIRVRMSDESVTTLSMADYLWRVVAAEMPASFELEALKAQAVTARTYTLYQMSIGANPNHPDADMCTEIGCCQAYIDPMEAAANWGQAAPDYASKITQAVSSTDGQAVLYDGAPIDAVFFSSAAGRTMDSVEVWGGSVPYLAGVESPEGAEVPNYCSTVTVPAEEFRSAFLQKYPEADLSGEPGGWFGEAEFTSSGAVGTVKIGGVTVKGTAIRSLFGLRSTSFTVSAGGENITFSVTGYGHGVGMSQYGANAMAKEGKSYLDILTHYYTGVSVAPWAAP